MSLRVFFACVLLAAAARAAETAPPTEEKPLSPREALKARMRAEGKKAPPPGTKAAAPTAAVDPSPAPTAKDAKAAAAGPEKPADTPATVLPKMEVRNSRITELDQQIAKQERDIAREKQNAKSTEADKALNPEKASKLLSIFGGESSQHREAIASERVSLMEAEKDILEAMKTARTKEERAVLQKQLDELKTVRRELEKTLR